MKKEYKSIEIIPAVLSIIVGVLAIVTYGVLAAKTENYFFNQLVYVLGGVAIVVQVVCVIMSLAGNNQVVKNIMSFIATMLYTAALIVFVVSSIEWISHLLSKDNVPAYDNSFAFAIAFFAVAIITQIITTFCQRVQK